MERKHILRRNRPWVSNFLSHRIVGFIKIHDFLHSWKVPSSPNDPWFSRWVQMGPSSSKWSLELQIKPINFPKKDPRKSGDMENLPTFSLFNKIASFFVFFGIFHGSPNDPWSSRWVQMGPSSSKWSLDLQIKPINFQKNDPNKQIFLGTWTTSQNLHYLATWFTFFFFYLLGPMPSFCVGLCLVALISCWNFVRC